jgi:ribosome biogenesis protein Nip4
MMINNKSFHLSIYIEEYLGNKTDLVYAGKYLGKDKRRFKPSLILLQSLTDEKATRKVSVDRESAWLFVCGNDIFEERLKPISGELRLGENYLVIFEGRCIGYGRFESSAGIKVMKNLFDVGDFLRREQ